MSPHLNVMLAVVRPRTETSSPSWSDDNTSAVKAIHLIHFVVSCFILRMPESAISKLAKEVGEKWEDAHDRLMVKVLGHAAVGLEPQWTNDSKSVNKVENKACSGRVCKTHSWCGFNADKTAFLLPEASRGRVAMCLGKLAATWDGTLRFPWSGDDAGSSAGRADKPKSKAAPSVIDFARLKWCAMTPDVVSIGIHPLTSSSQLLLKIPDDSFGLSVQVMVQNKLPEAFHGAVNLSGPNRLVHQSGVFTYDTSPPISLPRPLAREGAHSYLDEEDEDDDFESEKGYASMFSKEQLLARGDLTLAEGYAVLKLHLQKLKDPEPLQKKQRADKFLSAFALSPAKPRTPAR